MAITQTRPELTFEEQEAQQWDQIYRQQMIQRIRCILEGGILFTLVDFWFYGPMFLHLLAMFAVGSAAGFLWLVTRARTLLSPILAMVVMMLVTLVFAGIGFGDLRAVIWGTFAVGTFSAVLGALRDMR